MKLIAILLVLQMVFPINVFATSADSIGNAILEGIMDGVSQIFVLKLTQQLVMDSEKAKQLFITANARNINSEGTIDSVIRELDAANANIYNPSNHRKAEEMINDLVAMQKRIADKPQVTLSEAFRLYIKMLPFYRYLEVVDKAGDNAYVVLPPNSKRTMRAGTYCLNRYVGAPRSGQKMHLVSVENIFPKADKKVISLYRNLMKVSSKNNNLHSEIQPLIWALVHAKDKNPCFKGQQLTPKQHRILNYATPDGEAIFNDYVNNNSIESTIKDLFSSTVRNMADRTGLSQIANNVNSTLGEFDRIRNTKVEGVQTSAPIEYSMIKPGVVAKYISKGGIGVGGGGESIEIVNTTDKPQHVDTTVLIGSSDLRSQPTAIFAASNNNGKHDKAAAHVKKMLRDSKEILNGVSIRNYEPSGTIFDDMSALYMSIKDFIRNDIDWNCFGKEITKFAKDENFGELKDIAQGAIVKNGRNARALLEPSAVGFYINTNLMLEIDKSEDSIVESFVDILSDRIESGLERFKLVKFINLLCKTTQMAQKCIEAVRFANGYALQCGSEAIKTAIYYYRDLIKTVEV